MYNNINYINLEVKLMNKAGKYISNLYGELEYKSFLPSTLPPSLEMDDEFISLLVEANKN